LRVQSEDRLRAFARILEIVREGFRPLTIAIVERLDVFVIQFFPLGRIIREVDVGEQTWSTAMRTRSSGYCHNGIAFFADSNLCVNFRHLQSSTPAEIGQRFSYWLNSFRSYLSGLETSGRRNNLGEFRGFLLSMGSILSKLPSFFPRHP